MSRPIAVAAALLASCAAHAAPFADPTQPPAPRDQGDATAAAGPRLESILIAPDRRLAVVDGQQVTVGTRIAGGEVIRITDSEIVVRGAEGERALKMFPNLAAPAKAAAKRTAK